MRVVVALLAVVSVAFAIAASSDEPGFVRWLDPKVPLDAAIQDYWQRAAADELAATEWVDLGTMLFERGFANDAVDAYRSALDRDDTLEEAWFRIGLVYQKKGKLDDARRAYAKCLKIRPGHGWANFYLGLLEEHAGHPEAAIAHYQTAFRHAPALGDPEQNHELLYSDLALAARIDEYREQRFDLHAPMTYLEPAKIRNLQARLVPPTPIPRDRALAAEDGQPATAPPVALPPATSVGRGTHAPPTAGDGTAGTTKQAPWGIRGRATGRAGQPPAARPTPSGGPGGGGKNGATVHLRDVSPEARLKDLLPGLRAWLLPLDLRPT